MNLTNNVSFFNYVKLKLMAKDSLLEGVHGKFFLWKILEIICSGSLDRFLKQLI